MQLRSGHVALLRMEFQPPNCTPVKLTAPLASRWALPHISSYLLNLIPLYDNECLLRIGT